MIWKLLLIQGSFWLSGDGNRGCGSGYRLRNHRGLHHEHLLPDPERQFCQHSLLIKERVRITLEPAKNMAKIASSVFIEQVFMRTGFLLVSIMAARLGTSAYAAHQVAMNVMNLSFSFGDGMPGSLCGALRTKPWGEAPGSGGHVRDDLPEDRKHDLHRIVDPVPDVRKLVFPPVLC